MLRDIQKIDWLFCFESFVYMYVFNILQICERILFFDLVQLSWYIYLMLNSVVIGYGILKILLLKFFIDMKFIYICIYYFDFEY